MSPRGPCARSLEGCEVFKKWGLLRGPLGPGDVPLKAIESSAFLFSSFAHFPVTVG
jgi:hypothetical protein